MARTWLSIQVELVSGRGEYYWPRPGRIFVARRSFTFRQLATAINLAFGRWELAHLHRFVLGDGTEVVPFAWWDELEEGAADDAVTTLSRLELGERFAYEFDLGDGWEHLCTVGPQRIDPAQVYGPEPDQPVPYFGWGDLPDQHGRRWGSDDGSDRPPPQPDPPTSDLPPLMPWWGDWQPPGGALPSVLRPLRDWDLEAYGALRAAVFSGDGQAAMDLLADRVPTEAAQLAGDGLLLAVEQHVAGATALARELADDLRGQFDPGAIALANELDAVCGDDPAADLTPVPVELDELSMHLESSDDLAGGRLHLPTGRVWPVDAELVADDLEDWDEPHRWLDVTPIASREAWEDMREFAGTIDDGELGDRLLQAIAGPGAFRAFRLILDDHPETRDTWRIFAEERKRGRAREWLAAHGYRPARRADA